jgi:hypothetical protein
MLSISQILFNSNEFCWVSSHPWTVAPSLTLTAASDFLARRVNVTPADQNFGLRISLNPAKARNLSRRNENVLECRNFLFEFDAPGLTKDQQFDFLKKSGLPFSFATWSGNKSIHCVVCLDGAVSLETYKYLHAWVCSVFQNELPQLNIDPATNNPSQSLRAPWGKRLVGDSIKTQNLVVSNDRRISETELRQWLNTGSRRATWLSSESYAKLTAPAPMKRRNFTDNGLVAQYAAANDVSLVAGHWTSTQCPSCADCGRDRSRNNLGLLLTNGRVAYNCLAGCTAGDIFAAIRGRRSA